MTIWKLGNPASAMQRAANRGNVPSVWFRLATAASVAGIFAVDTITHLEIAVAVLYVAVVLMAALFMGGRGILLVTTACVGLTMISALISGRPGSTLTGVANLLIGVSAIVIAAFLAVQGQSADMRLKEQGRLLSFTHDAVIVRDMNRTIQYWNHGAEELYGFSAEEAVGKVLHQLLKTVFPQPIEEIEAEAMRTGRWEGELFHTKKDGTEMVVASRWALQPGERGKPAAILVTNNDITDRKQAEEALQRQANLLEQTYDAILA
jgi:PAS domain S-box-containing protein